MFYIIYKLTNKHNGKFYKNPIVLQSKRTG